MTGSAPRLRLPARALVPGAARGRLLVLAEPLSLWGGLDPASGRIIDRRHPQAGARVSGRVLALPHGRGSSSASSVLLEAVRLATAPAAILLAESDPILALGAAVARELYGRGPPVVVLDGDGFGRLEDGGEVAVVEGGERVILC
ncbi:MAG: DUF126 domain-containing protein [Acidobacteria bacterium]|nr:MAG: DUF126 domain-containing protein [Acidobacteriota bacterium]